MIILNNLTSNEVRFISRQGAPSSVTITDEQSKNTEVITPSFIMDGYTTTFTLSLTLEEGRKYKMIVEDVDGKKLYHDLLLVTTQDIEDFTLNDNEYQVDDEVKSTRYKFI